MEAHLISCIRDSLALYLHSNACFLGERLVAEYATEANKHLLATCYFQAGQEHRAHHVLQGCTSPESRYLLAMVCIGLGRLNEAEDALKSEQDSEVPMGAAGHFLLGKVSRLKNNFHYAVGHYQMALQLDPLLWCAYEELCLIGNEDAGTHFFEEVPQLGRQPQQQLPAQGFVTPDFATPRPIIKPAAPANPHLRSTLPGYGPALSSQRGNLSTVLESPYTPQGDQHVIPRAPPEVHRFAASVDSLPPSVGVAVGQLKFTDEAGKTRKVSGRLFDSAGYRPPHPQHSPIASTSEMGPQESAAGYAAVLALIRVAAIGFRKLCLYRCKEAIEAFQQLGAFQFETGWVLCQVGRAYFEMVDYKRALELFQRALRVDPTRLEGLEIYSTVLWHLKQEVELSHLAQTAISRDRESPYSWVVMGNCFSLQKEHESALRYFQRAIQLDPYFTYAYTLAGHEYYANEDFDKAVTCYRNAIRIAPRHYNAWYGLGQIFYRQEKYDMAEYHFQKSLQINPGSSVLQCYLGMSLHKLGRQREALSVLQAATAADPQNPLAKFEKAAVLVSMEEYRGALAELEQLKGFAPREASVWFQMGKIYKRLDMVDEAMSHFCIAMDLKPSSADASTIKAAIEKVRVTEDSEEEEI